MPSLRAMTTEEVAKLHKSSNAGARKAIEQQYDELIRDFEVGQTVEVMLDPEDSKINTRNRLKAAATRRGLEIKFLRVRGESLLRFELSANGTAPTDKKK